MYEKLNLLDRKFSKSLGVTVFDRGKLLDVLSLLSLTPHTKERKSNPTEEGQMDFYLQGVDSTS